jgi:hypothetical protein
MGLVLTALVAGLGFIQIRALTGSGS